MAEIATGIEQARQRQVLRLTGFTITGPDGEGNVAGTKRREIYPYNGRDDMAHYALVLAGVNVITIGRIYNPDSHIRAHRMASTIDIIVSRDEDGAWCVDLYADTGVDYETLLEMYNIDMLEAILGKFGMNVEKLPVYELSRPGEVFVIEPAIRPTGDDAVFLPAYNVATHKITGTEELSEGNYVFIGIASYSYGEKILYGFVLSDHPGDESVIVYKKKFYFIPFGSQIVGNLTEIID